MIGRPKFGRMEAMLVAFFGDKPPAIASFVRAAQGLLGNLGEAFVPYALEQVHATIIGLEGLRVAGSDEVVSANYLHLRRERRPMRLGQAFETVRRSPLLPLRVRIGGYREQRPYPFTSRTHHPYLRSFSIQGEIAIAIGWPYDGERYLMSLDELRRSLNDMGVLHKYHATSGDIDNDLFLVLGRIKRSLTTEAAIAATSHSMCELMAETELDVVIDQGCLAVVGYADPSLPLESSIPYGLDQVDPSQIIQLYRSESVGAGSSAARAQGYAYDVAISYAGEDRAIARAVADRLRREDLMVYFAEYERGNNWNENLFVALGETFGELARFCLVVVSAHYTSKAWTKHELSHIQARFFRDPHYLFQLKVDDTPLPGFPSTYGYLSLKDHTVEQAVALLVQRIGSHRGGSGAELVTPAEWEQRRAKLFGGLASPDYLAWQQELVETLYDGVEIVRVFDRSYSAALIRSGSQCPYPFEQLCTLTSTEVPQFPITAEQMDYVRMLGSSLKWPQMRGFALQRIHADEEGRVRGVDAVTTTFLQNLITCHTMESESYRLFERGLARPRALGAAGLLAELPHRAQYHAGRSGQAALYEPGARAYPLISVQAMVIFSNHRVDSGAPWRIVVAKRSEDVVVKPGFFQFQPAGGFEVYGRESDEDPELIRHGFDVRAAILREYAEELFDAKELQVKPDGRAPVQAVHANRHVRQLVDWQRAGRATIDFLGIVVDLSVLRHELSFLITISDDSFGDDALLGSWEAKHIITEAPGRLRALFASGMLHASSAGLLQLALESDRLRDLGIVGDIV